MGSEGGDKLPYPRGAYFILAGYLLERFVYYGLFGGAVFYMQRVLGFSASSSSTIKNAIEGLIYLAPILGAVLADSYLGKFRLVLYMCCGYVVGAAVYSLSAASPLMTGLLGTQATGIGGLLMFGLCAGIMKAVYSSMGPDQFVMPEQRDQQKSFFNFFYWMINAGAFAGQNLTAQLRDSVQCFGDDCFLLPYGILVLLMVCSTVIFFAGKRFYRSAPPDPMLQRVLRCMLRATKLKFTSESSTEKPVEHWVDRATHPGEGQVTDKGLIQDVKKTLSVLVLFTTFPIFWALFYQTSAGMIFQAKRLKDTIGSYRIPPELTSSINPLFILMLIPFFDLVVYPFLKKHKILTKTTSRMFVGMLFAVSSFVTYGVVNMQLEQTILGSEQAEVQIYNLESCGPLFVFPHPNMTEKWTVPAGGTLVKELTVAPGQNSSFDKNFVLQLDCGKPNQTTTTGTTPTTTTNPFLEAGPGDLNRKVPSRALRDQQEKVSRMIPLEAGDRSTLVFKSNDIKILAPSKAYIKDANADAKLRILCPDKSFCPDVSEFSLKYGELVVKFVVQNGTSEYHTLAPNTYAVLFSNKQNKTENIGGVHIEQDGVYDVVISKTSIKTFLVTAPADLHLLWVIPQYLLMTIGEVLFSVSGMDFAYSEAPMAMKSILQAANLLTITVGLWILAALTSITSITGVFDNRASNEAFTYSVLMLINCLLFYVLLKRYERIKNERMVVHRISTNSYIQEESGKVDSNRKYSDGSENGGYQEEQF